jgi:hypothetical protein
LQAINLYRREEEENCLSTIFSRSPAPVSKAAEK